MAISKVVAKQYRDKVNQAVKQVGRFSLPPEGWIRTVRNALGMSGTQLANRLGVSKARISKAEQGELTGGVTIKTMQNMAEAMNCRFVYGIVPEREIENLIRNQAILKAKARVKAASTHMALEAQTLNKLALKNEVERISSEIIEKMPSSLWSEE